jgi:hypothetical protein
MLRTALAMNSGMPRRLSQQHWRLLIQRRYAWRKPFPSLLPYWGLMVMTKGTGRRSVARALTRATHSERVGPQRGLMERAQGGFDFAHSPPCDHKVPGLAFWCRRLRT